MGKSILILWSGGYDSTYLVQKCLRSEYYDTVNTAYVELKNNKVQSMAEVSALNKLIEHFKAEYPNKLVHLGTVASISLLTYDVMLLAQPLLWAISAMYCPNVDEVAIGYVSGDCAISYLNDLHAVWSAMGEFRFDPVPKLTFPLSKFDKEYIYQGVKSIEHMIWYCERPIVTHTDQPTPDPSITQEYPNDSIEAYSLGKKFVACGRCDSCQRHDKHRPAEPTTMVLTELEGCGHDGSEYHL